MKKVLVLLLCCLLAGSVVPKAYGGDDPKDDAKEEAQSGKRILGKENIVAKERLSARYATIVIKDISFEGTSIQEVDETKHADFKDVVKKLGTAVPDTIVDELKRMGMFKKILREGGADDGLVLEMRFTKITTGNRAARFFVGFGAGSSTVGIEGKLVDKKTGEVLASFENNTHSPASMGDYHVVLPADGKNNGIKIARFINKMY